MTKVLLNTILGLSLISTLSYSSEWKILDIEMGTNKSELKKMGFKCEKEFNYCEAYRQSKYASTRKDLFQAVTDIKAYIDHKKNIYKIEIQSDISFELVEIQAYKNVFKKIAKKQDGIDIKIEEATILRGMPIVDLTVIDTDKQKKYQEYLEKKAMDIFSKYSKK